MQPQIYSHYLKVLQDEGEFEKEYLNSSPEDTLSFTVKNYKQPSGLSLKFF
jgi:hypothetical protein